MRQSGVSSRISRIVSAKTRALPILSSVVRFTLVTHTACFSPSVATASATRRGFFLINPLRDVPWAPRRTHSAA